MNENKEILTIEELKGNNNDLARTARFIIVFSLVVLAVVRGAISIVYRTTEVNHIHILIFMAIVIFISITAYIGFFFSWNKNKVESKNTAIDSGDFRIVEDKIYDKHECSSRENGDTKYHYYIFTKIYGKIDTIPLIYNNAEKDDLVYLLFYNKNEQDNHYNNTMQEGERNRNNIKKEYLVRNYELSEELLNKYTPYNKFLGEDNYNKRIQNQIESFRGMKTKVKCKKCETMYEHNKLKTCPSCHSVYNFDITDIAHKKEWYI